MVVFDFCLSCYNQKDDREESNLVQQQQSRRPTLTTLEIPTRSVENTLSNFTRIDIIPSPRGGLPPRPSSAKFRSSMRNLLPQRSFRGKNISEDDDDHEGDRTVLIIPNTPVSDKPPSTPRSFSLNKVLFSSSTKSAAHSLPVTPIAESVVQQENHLDRCDSVSVFLFILPFLVFFSMQSFLLTSPVFVFIQKQEVQHHMTRSFSVPVNVKNRSLRRTDSTGGLIRVLAATPRPSMVDSASLDKKSQEQEIEIGTFFIHPPPLPPPPTPALLINPLE